MATDPFDRDYDHFKELLETSEVLYDKIHNYRYLHEDNFNMLVRSMDVTRQILEYKEKEHRLEEEDAREADAIKTPPDSSTWPIPDRLEDFHTPPEPRSPEHPQAAAGVQKIFNKAKKFYRKLH